MKEALLQRESADKLIAELETAYVGTNERVKQDFGVEFVKEEIKYDIMNWNHFIKKTKDFGN